MKFSTKLSFAILFTGTMVLIIFSFMIFKFSSNEVIKFQFTQTKSITKEVAGDFDHLLSEKIKTALTLANTPILKNALETSNVFYTNLSDEKRKESIKRLNEQWKSTKDPTDKFIQKFTDNKTSHFLKNQQTILKGEYGEIFLTNKFGALVASTSKLSTFAHGHKYWWLGSYNNGAGAVFFDDRGYDDSVGGYVLGLVVPIRKGEEIIGILKCNLNILSSFNELISDANDKSIGKFKLARSGGMVVFEEGFEPLSTQIHNSIYKKINSKNNEFFIFNDSEKKCLVAFSEIKLTKGEKGFGFGGTFESIDHKKGNTGETWYVLCYRPMSLVRAPIIESTKWITLIGMALILILVLVSYLFGRKIAQPLAILDKATQKIGNGNFKYKIELRRKDEFGNLAHSFNRMINRLQQTTTSIDLLETEIIDRKKAEQSLEKLNIKLEEKVGQRTAKLSNSNMLLKQKMNELSETKAILQAAMDNSPAAIAIADAPDGKLRYVNKAGLNIRGGTYEDLVKGININNYVSSWQVRNLDGTEYKTDELPLAKAIRYGEACGDEFIIRRIDGEDRIVLTNAAPILDDEGNVKFGIVVFLDITDQKRLEEEVLKSRKLESLGTLAGGIAHDLNNLLFAVMGNISLVQDDLKPESGTSESLKEAEKACIKAKELSARLITFSKGGDPVKKMMSINDLLKDTVIPALNGSNIKPEISISNDIRNVNIDEGQIKQVVRNIVANAKEAMDDNGQLTVSCENIEIAEQGYLTLSQGKYIKISFQDHGCGISKENLEKIFDPYFSTKDMGADKGQGLGLTVSYSIIQKHGGLINVESEPQAGSNFSVYLPAFLVKEPDMKKSEEKPTAQKPVKQPATGTGKILLMDDEEAIRIFLDQVITRLGYDVETCTEGKETIEIYTKVMESKEPFDVVILDLTNKIGMGGQETMKRLLEIDPDVKGIIITGYSDNPVVANFRAYGFSGFITKPATRDELNKVINEVLSKDQ